MIFILLKFSDGNSKRANIADISPDESFVTLKLENKEEIQKKWRDFSPKFLCALAFDFINWNDRKALIFYLNAYEKYDDALEVMKEFTEIQIEKIGWRFPKPMKWFEIYYSEIDGFNAFIKIKQEKFEEAKSLIHKSLTMNKVSGWGNISAAQQEQHNENYLKSLEYLVNVPTEYRKLKEYLNIKISAFIKLKRFSDALITSGKLVKQYPKDANSYLMRAKIHKKYNNRYLALRDVNSGLSIDINNVELLKLKKELK